MIQLPYTTTLTERVLGAARFDVRTYHQIALDTGSTVPAALIVGGVALTSAIGGVSQFSWLVLTLLIVSFGWFVTASTGTHLVTAITRPAHGRSRIASLLTSLEPQQKHLLGIAGAGVIAMIIAGSFTSATGFSATALLIPFASWVGFTAACYLRARSSSPDVFALARAIGFAHAPGLFAILGFIPLLGFLVFPLVVLWMACAITFAIRHTLGIRMSEAFRTAVQGASITAALALILSILV